MMVVVGIEMAAMVELMVEGGERDGGGGDEIVVMVDDGNDC
jgi:hypothetical protein